MKPVVEAIDFTSYKNMVEKTRDYMYEDEHRSEAFQSSMSFRCVNIAKKYDDWFLDPIVGFLLPGVGDAISTAAILPSVYVAAIKLHSPRLTFAVIFCMLVDFICGAVPVVGDIIDALYMSNRKARRLIVGYVENDEETKSEINRITTWGLLILAIIAAVMWMLYKLVIWLWDSLAL